VSWTAVHLGQFIGMVIITFGLVALFFALDVRRGVGCWLNRFALLSAGAGVCPSRAATSTIGTFLRFITPANVYFSGDGDGQAP
jgi:hypothetical protein